MTHNHSSLYTGPKLAVLVVLYHPEDSFIKLHDHLLQSGLQTYVINNTPALTPPFIANRLWDVPFITLHKGRNIGLSRAYNLAFAQARADGFSHVLIFDQDTQITQDSLSFIAVQLAANPAVGMLNFSQHHPDLAGRCQKRLLVINSATIFNLEVHRAVGGFDETYFVDCVDYGYCLRCLVAQKEVWQIAGTPGLDHLTGQPGRAVKFFGKTLYARDYGARRNRDIFWGHLRLLSAGLASLQLKWSIAILRSLLIFIIGRGITFVLRYKKG